MTVTGENGPAIAGAWSFVPLLSVGESAGAEIVVSIPVIDTLGMAVTVAVGVTAGQGFAVVVGSIVTLSVDRVRASSACRS